MDVTRFWHVPVITEGREFSPWTGYPGVYEIEPPRMVAVDVELSGRAVPGEDGPVWQVRSTGKIGPEFQAKWLAYREEDL